jgi:hypothetical protein
MKRLEFVDFNVNDFKFKLEIKGEQSSLLVCIKCLLDQCVDESKSDCLFSVMLNSSDNIAILSDYYSDVLKGRNASELSHKLEGSIYAVLCILLHCALKQNLLDVDTKVVVSSENDGINEGRVKQFYEKLGFKYDHKVERMIGSAGDIFRVCMKQKDNISKEMLKIMSEVIGNFF